MTAVDEQPWAGDPIPEGSGVIEVRVTELRQFFNSMDPSPFREKDLDGGAEEFIVSFAKEFAANQTLALRVHLDKPAVRPDAADTLRDAVHAFFAREAEMSSRRLRELLRTGRKSLIIGLVFLTGCLLTGDWVVRLLPASRLAAVLRESVLAAGWRCGDPWRSSSTTGGPSATNGGSSNA